MIVHAKGCKWRESRPVPRRGAMLRFVAVAGEVTEVMLRGGRATLAECPRSLVFVCKGCKRRCGACYGAADDGPEMCDRCWAAAQPKEEPRADSIV